MTPRHLAMVGALLLAGGLVVFGDNRPDSGVTEAVERATPAAPAAAAPRPAALKTAAAVSEPSIARLIPRATLIGADDDAIGGDQNLFGSQNWVPPPPPPEKNPAPPPPPPPPMAPPLPFAYLGKAAADGSWEVFLTRGEKIYIVRDKMVIDGTYRIDAIAPPNMTFTYLPLKQVQQLNIGVLD